MKVKNITYSKTYKVGLPNYSNITAHMEATYEFEDDELPNHDAIWDGINRQIYLQTDVDPAWMKTNDIKDYHKLVIKIKKQNEQTKAL